MEWREEWVNGKNKFHFLPKIITRGNSKLMRRDITFYLRGETTFLSLPHRVFPRSSTKRRKRKNYREIKSIEFSFLSLLSFKNINDIKIGEIYEKLEERKKLNKLIFLAAFPSNFQFPGREDTRRYWRHGVDITGLKVSRVLSSRTSGRLHQGNYQSGCVLVDKKRTVHPRREEQIGVEICRGGKGTRDR